ncbi:hypothetical protein BV911_04765 [Pseudoruegeria sp. SK021]|nr:hypothetical protein BV911_04765 [Pseudoruegeria sp. SK021]
MPRTALVIGLLAALLAASSVVGYRAMARTFHLELARDGYEALDLYGEMTRGWLNRYRMLAPIYARDPRVLAVLRDPSDAAARDDLQAEMEIWNVASGTSVTYLMNMTGMTVAASNESDSDSFKGMNYGFRPYFREAAEGRLGRFFGLGTRTRQRGYYFAAPVRDGDRTLGVMTVKIEVDALERDLRLSPYQVFLSDGSGVVILSGNPIFRLTTLAPIDPEDALRIATARQFDLSVITPAPITQIGSWLDNQLPVVRAPTDRSEVQTGAFLHLTEPMMAEGWTLHLLMDTTEVHHRLWYMVLLLLACGLAICATATVIWQRRQRLLEHLRVRERMQAVLEQRVLERTHDLSAVNQKLRSEVGERRAAEASLRQSQSELIQAGKLAALGQMSAALTHEFNQPLTAIRTYAENAAAFVDAGATEKARENLTRIQRLTERMAQLSRHLTRFARRSQDTVERVSLRDTLNETLALLQGRLERADAKVTITGNQDLWVLGGQVRLQHVMMNLVGNALDAVPEGRRPEIDIDITQDRDQIMLVVQDNGDGIAPEVLPRIFDPFFTTKDVGKGLGLGLSISFNIVKDFEGALRAENRPEGGARFTVSLQTAPALTQDAAE